MNKDLNKTKEIVATDEPKQEVVATGEANKKKAKSAKRKAKKVTKPAEVTTQEPETVIVENLEVPADTDTVTIEIEKEYKKLSLRERLFNLLKKNRG